MQNDEARRRCPGPGCDWPALDGKVTCGNASCGRAVKSDTWPLESTSTFLQKSDPRAYITGLFVRVKRADAWIALDIAALTDVELLTFFQQIGAERALTWAVKLAGFIRDHAGGEEEEGQPVSGSQ